MELLGRRGEKKRRSNGERNMREAMTENRDERIETTNEERRVGGKISRG